MKQYIISLDDLPSLAQCGECGWKNTDEDPWKEDQEGFFTDGEGSCLCENCFIKIATEGM